MSYHIPEFVSENLYQLKSNTDEFHWLSVDSLWKIYVLWSKEVNINITNFTKFQFIELFIEELHNNLDLRPRNSEYGIIYPFKPKPGSIFFREN